MADADDTPRPGRPLTIELRRTLVTTTLALMAPAVGAIGVFLVLIPETYSRWVVAHIAGYVAFPLALYILFIAFRVATWSQLHVKLTRKTLEFPSLHGLSAHQVELDLADIEDVGFVENRGNRSIAIWSAGKRHGVAASFWLPKGWTPDRLARRISLRWQAAKRGLSGPELAAVETAWDDDDASGVAVRRKGKKWKVLANVEGRDDYERRRDRGRLDDTAELVLADEAMPEWRSIRDAVYLPRPK